MFSTALLKNYTQQGELVAFCDLSQTRMDYYNARFGKEFGIAPTAT